MKTRLLPSVMLLLSVSGCQKGAVRTCEEFIQSGLSAASSYKRISAEEYTRPVNPQDSLSAGKNFKLHMSSNATSMPVKPLHAVLIEYYARSDEGVSFRQKQICLFDQDKLNKEALKSALSKARHSRSDSCCLY